MTHLLRNTLFALTLTGSMAYGAVPTTLTVAVDDDSAYATGTKAMNESRWADAVTSFDQVIEAKGKKVEAALYWKAYALNKLGKTQLVSATCEQLRTQFKNSDWNKDCGALTVALVRSGSSRQSYYQGSADAYNFNFDFSNMSTHSKDPDMDMKILALNSLTHRDPAQAMPILRDILNGNQPMELKKHALFVLTQSRSPEAGTMMHDLILGKQGVELQRQAIQASALYKGKQYNDALVEVYRTTSDAQIRKAIISGIFISGDDVRMVELARAEKDPQVKRNIVSQLSLMKGKAADDYMMELLK